MPSTVLAGTDRGVHALGVEAGAELEGRMVGAMTLGRAALFAAADGTEIVASEGGGPWRALASLPSGEARCLLPTAEGLLVGTTEAHLLRLANDSLEVIEGFESIAGREGWYTPWGGPPATRSLSAGSAGELYANVHVGGIGRSDDGGASWRPMIDIDIDVHEVRSPTDRPGLVLAATGREGLATSHDSGESWELASDGLAGAYARAVALAGDLVLLTASDGPRGGHAAVYRRPLGSSEGFERCREGLPEWFDDNIDTACLDARDGLAAFGTVDGSVYASEDAGETWQQVAGGLPAVRCLLVLPGA
jgi:hypothetical protein